MPANAFLRWSPPLSGGECCFAVRRGNTANVFQRPPPDSPVLLCCFVFALFLDEAAVLLDLAVQRIEQVQRSHLGAGEVRLRRAGIESRGGDHADLHLTVLVVHDGGDDQRHQTRLSSSKLASAPAPRSSKSSGAETPPPAKASPSRKNCTPMSDALMRLP